MFMSGLSLFVCTGNNPTKFDKFFYLFATLFVVEFFLVTPACILGMWSACVSVSNTFYRVLDSQGQLKT